MIDDINLIKVAERLAEGAPARVKCEAMSPVLSIILSGTDMHRIQCIDFVAEILELIEMENEEVVARGVDPLARLQRDVRTGSWRRTGRRRWRRWPRRSWSTSRGVLSSF
jgi:hypothetical protein